MTSKGEKRVSSTPAQNQSEVEEWTGQSPSADSWLVSQQQGSISERDKQASNEDRRYSKHHGTQHADWIWDCKFVKPTPTISQTSFDISQCIQTLNCRHKNQRCMNVLLKMRGCTDSEWNDMQPAGLFSLNCVTPKALSVVSTEREGERENPQGENMTSMCVGNGHAGEGNESTHRGSSSLGLMGHWGSLYFSPGKRL